MNEEVVTNEGRSIVVPALISGVVGAGLALLLAPKSGSELRQDIGRFARKTAGQAQETAEEAKSAATEALASGQESIAEATEQLYEPESESRSLLVPILVSGVVGAALALLFAPKSGKEMMEDIKDFASTAVDKGKDLYSQGASALKEAMEKGKEAAAETQEKLRPAA